MKRFPKSLRKGLNKIINREIHDDNIRCKRYRDAHDWYNHSAVLNYAAELGIISSKYLKKKD